MKKQILLFVMMVLMPMMASADDSGSCGYNVTYSFKEINHTLTISGTGAMWDYNYYSSNQPWANYKDQILYVIIESGVTSIGNSAFDSCSNLTAVSIPNSVTTICPVAFSDCSSLTSVTIPNSVTSIGTSAFKYCSSLTSVTIPNGVTSIGFRTFYKCSSLTSVTIPNSVTSIGEGAFYGCSSLTSVHITDLKAWCKILFCYDYYGSRYDSNPLFYAHHLYLNGVEIEKLVIPNGITTINDYAFCGCSLTFVTIPNSVTSIGYGAFYDCSGLTSVTIPNSVTSIGGYAFLFCI